MSCLLLAGKNPKWIPQIFPVLHNISYYYGKGSLTKWWLTSSLIHCLYRSRAIQTVWIEFPSLKPSELSQIRDWIHFLPLKLDHVYWILSLKKFLIWLEPFFVYIFHSPSLPGGLRIQWPHKKIHMDALYYDLIFTLGIFWIASWSLSMILIH